jgi:hypothetical protein
VIRDRQFNGGMVTRRRLPARQWWFAGLRARANPIWAKLLDDDLPILIVVGDYYIVGESSGRSAEIERLVREFPINSRLELSQYKETHPESGGRYTDLDLSYLPTAIGPALRELMPLLAVPKKRVRVVMTSKLTADEFRQSHIVYLGHLSGLGMLSDIVLSGRASGFSAATHPAGRRYDGVRGALRSIRRGRSQRGRQAAGRNAPRYRCYLGNSIVHRGSASGGSVAPWVTNWWQGSGPAPGVVPGCVMG